MTLLWAWKSKRAIPLQWKIHLPILQRMSVVRCEHFHSRHCIGVTSWSEALSRWNIASTNQNTDEHGSFVLRNILPLSQQPVQSAPFSLHHRLRPNLRQSGSSISPWAAVYVEIWSAKSSMCFSRTEMRDSEPLYSSISTSLEHRMLQRICAFHRFEISEYFCQNLV